MSDDIAITVEHVSKTFKLPHERTNSIKGAVVNFYNRNTSYEKQQALKDVSFAIKKGEFFGIVGRNGSGKSTLLKLLAGIYSQSHGEITINGKLTPFIELGVGFNPELSGRENIFLNGALLGFNRKEMTAMYHDIVEFAELERFMDQKLKNYSSGMQVRLAFSIAIRAQSDILLIDEVLAVGDASFQQKCFDVFAELKKRGVTIVLVTHDMNSVLRFCDRAMMINKGEHVLTGKPMDVADAYLELNYKNEKTDPQGVNSTADDAVASIESATIYDSENKEGHELKPGEACQVAIHYRNPKGLPIHFGLQVFNDSGTYCFGTNTFAAGLKPVNDKSGKKTCRIALDLVPGTYYFTLATMSENGTTVYDYKSKLARFRITKTNQLEGVALLNCEWDS